MAASHKTRVGKNLITLKLFKMKQLFYILILPLFFFMAGCSKADEQAIGDKSDQALIQDVVVYDATQTELSVTKAIPKIILDPATNVERADTSGGHVSPLPIVITVKAGVDLTKLSIRFTLSSQSKYAKVAPALGHIEDFTAAKNYTVTSQSGKNVSVYSLVVKLP